MEHSSQTAARRAEDGIRELVRAEGLREGDRLPTERALVERLGASRATVREGLQSLVSSGLLEARQGSGTYVAAVDLTETMQLRCALEPLAAALAARSRTPGEAGRIARLVAAAGPAIDDDARFAECDRRVHDAVAGAARNAMLARALDDLATLTAISRRRTAGDPATRRATLATLQALATAIADRDAARAEAAMRSHMLDIAARLGFGADADTTIPVVR